MGGVTKEPMNHHGNCVPNGNTRYGAQHNISPDGALEVGSDASQKPKYREQDSQADCAKRYHDQRPPQEGGHETTGHAGIGGHYIRMSRFYKIKPLNH